MNLDHIFRKTHIQIFNPPYIHSDPQREKDPYGWVQKAYQATWEGRPGTFIQWIEEEHPNWRESSLAHHLVGRSYKYEGDFESAKKHLQCAFEMRKQQGFSIGMSETLVVLSEVAIDEEQLEQAWELLNQAVSLAPHHRSPHINRFCLASLAEDEPKLNHLFTELESVYPQWARDEKLCDGLQKDGELFFLREQTDLWKQIETRIQH